MRCYHTKVAVSKSSRPSVTHQTTNLSPTTRNAAPYKEHTVTHQRTKRRILTTTLPIGASSAFLISNSATLSNALTTSHNPLEPHYSDISLSLFLSLVVTIALGLLLSTHLWQWYKDRKHSQLQPSHPHMQQLNITLHRPPLAPQPACISSPTHRKTQQATPRCTSALQALTPTSLTKKPITPLTTSSIPHHNPYLVRLKLASYCGFTTVILPIRSQPTHTPTSACWQKDI